MYQLYFKDVFLYLRSLAASEQIAEEIAQETFFKALKSIDQFDGSKDIKAWLFTIAKNTYFTYSKRQKIYSDKSDAEFLNTIPATEFMFTDNIENEEQAFLIHGYLHNMKEPYKEVFTLRVFGELSFEKIALLFNKSNSWARVTFYRAKKLIIEYMEELQNE